MIFFPTSSSDGSSGGTAAIARDNLNDAISDQLNMFSDKLLGDTGFNLNFGLINSNLIISYDNSQFENVDLETRIDEKVVEPVVTPPVVEEPESTQLGIAPFVDQSKDSQHYTDRYFKNKLDTTLFKCYR